MCASCFVVNKEHLLGKKGKTAMYNSVHLSTLLYGNENWVCQEKYKSKLNTMSMGYLESVCDRTSRNRTKNEWMHIFWKDSQNKEIGTFKIFKEFMKCCRDVEKQKKKIGEMYSEWCKKA